jgi:acyl-CoA synthetase (AMP-forming)/AMP-acid ligase II
MLLESTAQEPSVIDLLHRWAATRGHRRAFTFVDFPDSRSAGRHRTLTWSQLSARAHGVAAAVSRVAGPGDRVAVLLPQGLDYVTGFLGCLLARVIAVPLFPPDLPGHENRVDAVLDDCEPACVLVDAAGAAVVQAADPDSAVGRTRLVRMDECGTEAEGPREAEPVDPDEIAYLQYTSGSTRTPTGAMITHRNAVANGRQALTAFGVFDARHGAEDLDEVDGAGAPVASVGWLPLFHDMGLLLSVAAPLVGGFPSVLMDPIAFLARPERWLRLLSTYPGALSAAPNFAYDYCAAKVSPAVAAELSLGRVRALVNGSEPVRADTVRRFSEAFESGGLRPEVHCPSYGLAEATVFVASDGPAGPPRAVVCRRAALAEGRIEVADDAAAAAGDGEVTSLVGCGVPVGQELKIVRPGTSQILPEDVVGEIVVRGPNVASGYWKRAEQSAEVFGAVLPGTGDRPWLRTGDLGAMHDGRLLVTGRLKDLLIVDGRNHYPQDVEETVQCALGGGHHGRAAVFSVPGDTGELVVAVAEQRRDLTNDPNRRAVAERAARARVAAAHGLRLDRLVLVPPGSIPRTSSNKVSRSACRAAFLRGDYTTRAREGFL